MIPNDQNKISAFDVAAYFLHRADIDNAGDLISNLKLQKLLYYAQGSFLAVKGAPVFDEEIRAWPHGPVVVEVYEEYKQYGSAPIATPDNYEQMLEKFNDDQIELLDEVYNVFGQYSAWRLREMTHQEDPWLKYKDRVDTDRPAIDLDIIKRYFKTLLIDDVEK